MELIKTENDRYREYETLLLERDQLRKEAGQTWTAYMQTFGQLIMEVYEQKVECIKRKKTIAYYQAALNRGGTVDAEAMQKFLEGEMTAYYANLKRMTEDNARCRNAGRSSAYEVKRSKTLYRRLAKLLHPDMHPETDRDEQLLALWQRILTAYGMNDVKALSELEVLVRKALSERGEETVRIEVPDIAQRIGELKAEVEEILHTEPYTYGQLLDDEEAVARKTKELTEELEEYRRYGRELDEIIHGILEGGGITIKWRMN